MGEGAGAHVPPLWTADQTADLIGLWNAYDLTTREIAVELNTRYGTRFTRLAVIARAHRLGAVCRPRAHIRMVAKPMARIKPVSASLVSSVPQPFVRLTHAGRATAVSLTGTEGNDIAVLPVADQAPVGILGLEPGMCRMTVTIAGATETLFCGCPCRRGARGRFETWCAAHKPVAVAVEKPRPVITETMRSRRALSFDHVRRRARHGL